MEIYRKAMYLITDLVVRQQYRQAVRYCNIMFKNGADTEQLAIVYAHCLAHEQGTRKAIRYLKNREKEAYMMTGQHSLPCLLALSSLYQNRKKYRKALKIYQQLYESFVVRHPETLFNMGCCHHRLGDIQNAKRFYKEALIVRPEMFSASLNLKLLDTIVLKPLVRTEKTKRKTEKQPIVSLCLKINTAIAQLMSVCQSKTTILLLKSIESINNSVIYYSTGSLSNSYDELRKVLEKHKSKSSKIAVIARYYSGFLCWKMGNSTMSMDHFEFVYNSFACSDSFKRFVRKQVWRMKLTYNRMENDLTKIIRRPIIRR